MNKKAGDRPGQPKLPPVGWTAPANIVKAKVCVPSGLLPTAYCQQTRSEVFAQGTEPTAPCRVFAEFTRSHAIGAYPQFDS